RSKEKKCADWATGGVHPGQIHLIDIYNLFDRFVLADNELPQITIEGLGISPCLVRIQFRIEPHHLMTASPLLLQQTAYQCADPSLTRSSGYFLGFDGRTSTRLISVRSGVRRSILTMSAMSSGAIFQVSSPPLPNSVATLPGMI